METMTYREYLQWQLENSTEKSEQERIQNILNNLVKGITVEYEKQPYNIYIKFDGEVIKKIHFENAIDFITMLHVLEKKNGQEILDWTKGYCTFLELEEGK